MKRLFLQSLTIIPLIVKKLFVVILIIIFLVFVLNFISILAHSPLTQ